MGLLRQTSIVRLLGAIGPGMIVAGSVIGSGELVNVPVQAAKFGFVLLWAVLVSCVIKIFLQIEIGRHCLVHNRTTIQALNECPGPRWRGTSWTALLYMLGYIVAMMPAIGILGLLGALLHGVLPLARVPESSIRIWAIAVSLATLALLWQGWYSSLEKLVMLLVGSFSIAVGVGVVLIQGTEYRISSDELLSGATFSLGESRGAAFAVVSLMGALGTAANELFMYPYWILEKGYARELGEPASEGWTGRARHWINMIRVDAGLSTAVATLVTAAFFLLGCAVLHREGIEPKGIAVVDQISAVFTQTYGQWSKLLFTVGAFCTLYSTLVVVVAASGRMWADLLGSLGYLNRESPQAMRRCHQVVQVVWLGGLLAAFLTMSTEPKDLIVVGHFVLGAFMTPLLMGCICWLAFQTDRRVRMNAITAAFLLGSSAVFLACVLYGLVKQG